MNKSHRAPAGAPQRGLPRGRSLREAVIIVIIGTALALVANAVSPRGIPLVGDFSRGAALANRSEEELRALPPEIELAGVEEVVAAIAKRSADAEGEEGSASAADDVAEQSAEQPAAPTTLAAALIADAILIDARTPDVYAAGHIPGALNLPVADFDTAYPPLKKTIEAASLLVVYCDGGDCELSHDLATMLKDLGHGPLQLFSGGFDEWMAGGNSAREGPEP